MLDSTCQTIVGRGIQFGQKNSRIIERWSQAVADGDVYAAYPASPDPDSQTKSAWACFQVFFRILGSSSMSAKFHVFISDFQHGSVEIEQQILGDLATVETLDCLVEQDMWGRADEADALMVYHTLKVTRATIERLTRCRLIVRCGVGFDNVDHVFARECGIAVANVPDYGTDEVADSAIGLTLALTPGSRIKMFCFVLPR